MAGMTSQRNARSSCWRSWALALSLVGTSVGVLACEKVASEAPAKLGPCAQVGQRCEFSPGKFGSCVQRDDCHDKNCFVCQSQH
jgi:hypothetical protein